MTIAVDLGRKATKTNKQTKPTNEEDPLKNEGARVVTTDLPL